MRVVAISRAASRSTRPTRRTRDSTSEVVVPDELTDKVFITALDGAVRIRTGEHGEAAL